MGIVLDASGVQKNKDPACKREESAFQACSRNSTGWLHQRTRLRGLEKLRLSQNIFVLAMPSFAS